MIENLLIFLIYRIHDSISNLQLIQKGHLLHKKNFSENERLYKYELPELTLNTDYSANHTQSGFHIFGNGHIK